MLGYYIMNDFTDIVFVFVFVFVLMYYEVINVRGSDVIFQKLFICFGVFWFVLVLELIKSVNTNCIPDVRKVLKKCALTTLYAFIGFTVLTDVQLIEKPKEFTSKLCNATCQEFTIGLFVVIGIAVGRSMQHMFSMY